MNRSLQLIIIAVIVAVAIVSIVLLQSVKSTSEVSVEEVNALSGSDTSYVLIDVRTPQEHDQERIANTPLFPLQELESRVQELDQYKNRRIIVYCRSGNRSGMAAEILKQHGFNVYNMSGGIIRWKEAEFSTIKGLQ